MANLKVQATATGYNTVVVDAPTLEGSEKQMSWAEDIRAQKAAELNKQVNSVAQQQGWDYTPLGVSVATGEPGNDLDALQAYADQITEMINAQIGETAAKVFGNTSAKYWIDNRDASLMGMLQDANK